MTHWGQKEAAGVLGRGVLLRMVLSSSRLTKLLASSKVTLTMSCSTWQGSSEP